MNIPQTLCWQNTSLILLDQTRLPLQEIFIECHDYRRVAEAIRRLEVRGAPAIGAAAAFALVLGAQELLRKGEELSEALPRIAKELQQTRPTAVNLFWAIERMMKVASSLPATLSRTEQAMRLETEAVAIAEGDRRDNELMAGYGASLFTKPVSVLTHCNAGALATVAVGTALGVISRAWQAGHITGVYAGETRPLLQGARLTAFELSRQGIPVT